MKQQKQKRPRAVQVGRHTERAKARRRELRKRWLERVMHDALKTDDELVVILDRRGELSVHGRSKAETVRAMARIARASQPSQLFIKGKDGKTKEVRTYGADPTRRSP